MASARAKPNILIIRLSSIGDVLFCTPVAKGLREVYPQGHLAWLVEEKSREVVEGNEFLDEVIVWPRLRWRRERPEIGLLRFLARHVRFLWRLRRRRFDLVLDLQGMARSAFLAWLTGARQRVGFQEAQEMAQVLYNNWMVSRPSAAHICEKYLLAASYLAANIKKSSMSIPFTDQDSARAERLLTSASASSGSAPSAGNSPVRFTAFCPSASRPHKLWPAQRFAEVADWVGETLGLLPLFVGAKEDITYIESIRRGCSRPTVSLAGSTSLKEAAALLARSQLVIGTDTALTHIGVGLGKPVVTLFGPAGVDYEPRGPLHEAVRADCDCSPCWTRVRCQENYKCMLGIQPDQVLEAARRVLAAERQGRP